MGFSPYANSYLTFKNLNEIENYYPLRVFVCKKCFLVQTQDFANPGNIFSKDYAYYSSTSKLFLDHAKKYSEKIINFLKLDKRKQVYEIASNDGYLLKNFVKKKIPCTGIEPAINAANKSEKLGIKVIKKFFSSELAKTLFKKADLICANNVYAHVPDINDFTKGLRILLKENGTITLEFPHLLK
jgi:2-polyprenyl-3-methyl-5-hydroxy-6-metoxy-1,4-benzoquinol methylase